MSEPRSLRIGIIAPPWVAIPPPLYGGTELVIDLLARGLAAAGHQVQLFTTGDSTCPVERRWRYPQALGTNVDVELEQAHARAAYLALAEDVDVIHDHTWAGPPWALQEGLRVPIVTTNHGPFHGAARAHFGGIADRVAVVAISHAQRRTAPEIPVAAVIHHGLDVDRHAFGAGGDDLLFLGRMSPNKGVHLAVEVARRSGRHLVIAAKMWEPAELDYFREVVQPALGRHATYVGEVGPEEKAALLRHAWALVNPIQWSEPFGLVMIESLVHGTPVLAFPFGAAPEIVVHGRNGFLCRDVDDVARHVDEIGTIDRRACRRSVVDRFSATAFVDAHVKLYREVLHRGAELVA